MGKVGPYYLYQTSFMVGVRLTILGKLHCAESRIKNELKQHMTRLQRMRNKYCIQKVFEVLVGPEQNVHWAAIQSLNIGSLNGWRMQAGYKPRIDYRRLMCAMIISLICGSEEEPHDQLFFHCYYSKICIQEALSWLGVTRIARSLQKFLNWARRCYKGTKTLRAIVYAVVAK